MQLVYETDALAPAACNAYDDEIVRGVNVASGRGYCSYLITL